MGGRAQGIVVPESFECVCALVVQIRRLCPTGDFSKGRKALMRRIASGTNGVRAESAISLRATIAITARSGSFNRSHVPGFYAGGAPIAATSTPKSGPGASSRVFCVVYGSGGGTGMIVWWLVLVTVGGGGPNVPMIHVGTFSSLANCQAAANGAAPVDTVPGGKVTGFVFTCVQANDSGSSPPQ
jgi:hypothetical protein